MVFKVKKFNDVSKLNIGRSENKMAANMAEIWYSNGYISSSMRPGVLNVGINFMVFGAKNAITSSDLTLDYQKTRWWPIWRKYGIKMAITRVLSQLATQCWCQIYGS